MRTRPMKNEHESLGSTFSGRELVSEGKEYGLRDSETGYRVTEGA